MGQLPGPEIELNATLDQMSAVLNDCEEKSPFRLENEGEYQAWRARKLRIREELPPTRVFRLDPRGLLPDELLESVRRQVDAHNFVLFESPADLDKAGFLALNRQFGLYRLDANPSADEDRVSSLQVVGAADERAQYIPYTNRALNWHTDGYYNPQHGRINAFALYCVNQAARGGGNYLFDHEWMYLLIRDRAPELLEVLMRPDLMRVPANVQAGRIVRAEESGPVFSIRQQRCGLNMRYTSRPRNIVWKADKLSERALNLVREILMDSGGLIEVRLQARQGLVCNNILHGRQAFSDSVEQPPRLIYRARFLDAIEIEPPGGPGRAD